MQSTLIQMVMIMAFGLFWRWFQPLGLNAQETRKVLTSAVFYVFLPAMVLDVLWRSDIGWHSLQFTALGTSSIMVGIACMWVIGHLFRFGNKTLGAVILAAAFPNTTYLGLPVLEQTFGTWSRSVVIQLDLFATAPLLFTLGIALCKHYGQDEAPAKRRPFWVHLNSPPFWAAGAAVALNSNQISQPPWLFGTLKMLSGAVVPLMLFSIGLALDWSAVKAKNLPYVLPVILIKMLLMPWFAWKMVDYMTVDLPHKQAAVLDIAMPSMLLGIVFCDRYRLDSSLYATAVTITTALSLVVLPLWHQFLMKGF
jgi:malate permease and related proteins